MAEYLSFEEVAAVLKCDCKKVRKLVIEDKRLEATRITPTGIVVDSSGQENYGLAVIDCISDEGAIASGDHKTFFDGSGNTTTIHVGYLRVERSDLDRYMTENGTSSSQAETAKPLSTIERNTLLTIIAALAKHAKIDVKECGKSAQYISGLTDEIGANVAKRTIEEHLKKIPDALAVRMK